MAQVIIAHEDTIQIVHAWNSQRRIILCQVIKQSFNAEEYNNGVSGNGKSKIYMYQDFLKAKASLIYYEKELFEMVRNAENECQAELFVGSIPGVNPTAQHHFSKQEILEAILHIKEFQEALLKATSSAKFDINFG